MIAAGTLSNDKGSFNVQVPSLIESRNDLLNIPIKSNNFSVIKLRDVAEIRDSFREKKVTQEIMAIRLLFLKFQKDQAKIL